MTKHPVAPVIITILALGLAGCSAPATSGLQPSDVESMAPSATAAPSPTASPSPSPSPTPAPIAAEITRISVSLEQPEFRDVWAEIHNPNDSFGWLRAAIEITALGPEGEVLGVQTGALPGAPCCTVYRLAPDGTYAVNMLVQGAVEVADIEIRIVDEPIVWAEVADAIPAVTVTQPSLSASSFVANQTSYSVTGRVEVNAGGPYNIQVLAIIEGDGHFWVAQGGPDCLSAGAPAAFEVTSLGPTLANPRLGQVIAFTTTVPGYTDPPPGC